MVKNLLYLVQSARPRQLIKNSALFIAIVFNGWLFEKEKFLAVFSAGLFFSLITSAIYLFNDVMDAEKDRLHPYKKNRPLASGKLSKKIALSATLILSLSGLFFSFNLSIFFGIIVLAYFILHVAYSLKLKHLPIFDVLAIASGFILRVYAGAAVINAHINVWLLLCIVSFSIFLAVGKRRSELTLLTFKHAGEHRQVLFAYPENLLDNYVSMFANTTWLTYAFFSFMYPLKEIKSQPIINLISILPRTFTIEKLLMATVPLVIFGVMRYLWIIYHKGQGDSPEKILLKDSQLLATVIIWMLAVIVIIY